MYRMVKIYWLGEVVYPRTISPEPQNHPNSIFDKFFFVHINLYTIFADKTI